MEMHVITKSNNLHVYSGFSYMDSYMVMQLNY